MANMSYASAGVVAPSVSTDNSPTFFKPVFDHIFAQFNGDDAIVTAATTLWTPGTDSTLGLLVKRSTAAQDGVGGGGAHLAWVALQPNAASVAGYTHRRFSAGTTSSPVVLYAEDGSTVLAQWLYEGTINAQGGNFAKPLTLNSPAAQAATVGVQLNFNAAQSANLLSMVVGATGVFGFSPQGDFTALRYLFVGGKTIVGANGVQLLAIGGLEASATGTDMVLHVASGWYLNSSNITVPFAANTIAVASSGTNQYVGVYADDGGSLHLTAYAATSAVTFPASAAKALYLLYVPASATQFVASLNGAAGQAVIAADLRFLSGGGTGGGTGTGMALAAPAVTIGDYTSTAPNTIDILPVLSGTSTRTINGRTLGVTNQGTNAIAGTQGGNAFLADALYQSVSPNVVVSLAAAGGALQLTTTSGPIFLSTSNTVGGVTTNRMGVITGTTTTAGSASGAGIYKLVARLPASGPPTLYLTTAGISTYDIALCNVYYDGSAWQFGAGFGLVDWSPVQTITNGAQMQPIVISGVQSGAATTVNAASYTSPALVASGTLSTFVVTPSVAMRGFVAVSAYVSIPGSLPTGNVLFGPMVNGSFAGVAAFLTDIPINTSGTRAHFAPIQLNAGVQYTIGMGAQTTAGSYTLNFGQMWGWLFR